MKRVFVPGAHPGAVSVSGPTRHYLVTVLRVQAGDALDVFDGVGHSFSARVDSVGADALRLTLGEPRTEPPVRKVLVLQGLPKKDKFEWVIEKGVELGASEFFPVETERSIVRLKADDGPKKQQRWQKIASEAARQCGRSDVPQLHLPGPLLEAVGVASKIARVLVLDEEETQTRLAAALPESRESPVALVIGPEGGLTRDEVKGCVALGAVAVSLGRNILRTETAALAAISIIRHLDGDLG